MSKNFKKYFKKHLYFDEIARMYESSETNYRGTGCGKAARPDLWGSRKVTNRSTRAVIIDTISAWLEVRKLTGTQD